MIKSECLIDTDSKKWETELKSLAQKGNDFLLKAEKAFYYFEGRSSNHQKIDQGATAAVEFLNNFQKSAEYANAIIAQHKKWLEMVKYHYRLTKIDFSNQSIKIDFESYYHEEDTFSLFYERGNKRWGHTKPHGDLIVESGMSSHYLEGITDVLEAFVKTNHFENLIKKDRHERAHDCFDWPKISKQKDIEKICNLLKDQVFLDLIQENKLQDIINSYDAYRQSNTARKTNIRLKNIISKACSVQSMPQPPGAFCKAKDTAGMGEKSGVYFGWKGETCFYVGRSNHIEHRLKSHHVINLEDEVSWLEMPDEDTHANELFYIWLLEPECNGQIKLAKKSKSLTGIEPTS